MELLRGVGIIIIQQADAKKVRVGIGRGMVSALFSSLGAKPRKLNPLPLLPSPSARLSPLLSSLIFHQTPTRGEERSPPPLSKCGIRP